MGEKEPQGDDKVPIQEEIPCFGGTKPLNNNTFNDMPTVGEVLQVIPHKTPLTESVSQSRPDSSSHAAEILAKDGNNEIKTHSLMKKVLPPLRTVTTTTSETGPTAIASRPAASEQNIMKTKYEGFYGWGLRMMIGCLSGRWKVNQIVANRSKLAKFESLNNFSSCKKLQYNVRETAQRVGNEKGIGVAVKIEKIPEICIKKHDPNPEKGNAMVNVWYMCPSRPKSIGHISLELSDGQYLSHWPDKQEKLINTVFSASKGSSCTFKEDCDRLGPPHDTLKLTSLNESAIKDWLEHAKFEKYNLFFENCATVVAKAISVGDPSMIFQGKVKTPWNVFYEIKCQGQIEEKANELAQQLYETYGCELRSSENEEENKKRNLKRNNKDMSAPPRFVTPEALDYTPEAAVCEVLDDQWKCEHQLEGQDTGNETQSVQAVNLPECHEAIGKFSEGTKVFTDQAGYNSSAMPVPCIPVVPQTVEDLPEANVYESSYKQEKCEAKIKEEDFRNTDLFESDQLLFARLPEDYFKKQNAAKQEQMKRVHMKNQAKPSNMNDIMRREAELQSRDNLKAQKPHQVQEALKTGPEYSKTATRMGKPIFGRGKVTPIFAGALAVYALRKLRSTKPVIVNQDKPHTCSMQEDQNRAEQKRK